MPKTKGRTILHKLTNEQREGLRKFQEIYGDEWREVLDDHHRGLQQDNRGRDVAHLIRQIRNSVTPNARDLPDLRVR